MGAIIAVIVCEGGAAIGMLLWALVKYLYNEINIVTNIDADFSWPEYFWFAFCWLSLGLLTIIVAIIVITGLFVILNFFL